MMKISKFLLCENPMLTGDHDGRLFILHARDPKLLAEVHHYENISEDELKQLQQQITVGGKLEYGSETILFEAIWVVSDGHFSLSTPQQQADELASIMRRMADWYEAYLNWEDKQ